MNISKREQRVLHVLAQGGAIHVERLENGKVVSVRCFTRAGHVLNDCDLQLFRRLKARGFIRSVKGQPYRATRLGARSVLAQHDNR